MFAAQAKLGCSSQLIINEAEVAVQQSAECRNTNLRGDHLSLRDAFYFTTSVQLAAFSYRFLRIGSLQVVRGTTLRT